MSLHAKSIRDGRSVHTHWLTAEGRRGMHIRPEHSLHSRLSGIPSSWRGDPGKERAGGGGCPLSAREMDGLTRLLGVWSLEKGLPYVGQDPPTF